MQTKTQRLIDRIKEKESFNDVAYLCEDFETFEIEVAEWGVDHAHHQTHIHAVNTHNENYNEEHQGRNLFCLTKC